MRLIRVTLSPSSFRSGVPLTLRIMSAYDVAPDVFILKASGRAGLSPAFGCAFGILRLLASQVFLLVFRLSAVIQSVSMRCCCSGAVVFGWSGRLLLVTCVLGFFPSLAVGGEGFLRFGGTRDAPSLRNRGEICIASSLLGRATSAKLTFSGL